MSNLGDILDSLRRERWAGEGLVGNFKLQLEESSIEIVSKRGNSFCLRKGDTVDFPGFCGHRTPSSIWLQTSLD